MSSNLKVNTILPSVGSNIGLGTNGGNLNVDGGCKVQVGTALTLGHTVGVQFATQNLHSTGFEVNQINASGIITASHFYGSGANLTGVISNIVEDSSPQLGGGLASNGFNINFADSSGTNNMAKFGASGDLQIYHDSAHSRIVDTGTGDLKLQTSKLTIGNVGNSETMASFTADGAVQLNYDNVSMFETESRGAFVKKGNGSDTTFTVGSTDASGVRICLDGDSNGDAYGNDYAFLQHDSSGDFIISADNPAGNSNLIFKSGNSSERLRITSGGRILGGNHLNDRGAVLQIESSDHAMIGIHRNTADHGAPAMNFSASRGTSAGSNTIVQSGDYLGLIRFSGTDGSDLATGAMITGIVDGTPGSNDMPTRLGFWTSADGSQSPTERLRIDSNGYVTKTNTPFVMVTINSRTDWATTGSFLTIPWDTIHGRSTNSNVGSHFNTSNHRFTAPVDGRYLFVLSMNIVGDNIMRHNINGAAVSKGEYRMTQLVWDHIDASFIYDMNANDYYTTTSRLYDGSGKRWNGGNNASEGWDTLSIYLLG